MGNEASFKSQFQFLETEFGLGLVGFHLQELGAPPVGTVVYRDRFDSIGTAQGGDLPDLARVLREHLPAIREILVGRKGK
jgi:hypothetical protein